MIYHYDAYNIFVQDFEWLLEESKTGEGMI
jgi:hypothetical protein